MCSLAVMLLVFAGVMYWISSNGKQLRRNQTFMSSQAAAEGATEMVFAQMDRDYLFGTLNSSVAGYQALAPITTNWPVQYTFNVNVSEGQQSATLQYLNNQYTNLLGEPQTVTVSATATPVGQFQTVPATVSQTVTFAEVPVFQFAIFYNLDLDMSPGSAMAVNGNTFCNENIWCYPGGQMTFNGSVEAAGNYFFHWDTNGDQSSNIASPAKTPIFNDGTPLSHADPLVLPIGAGANSSSTTNNSSSVEAIINIPPASVAAPQQIAYVATNQVYLFNEASLIVSNAAYGVNGVRPWSNSFTVYLQDIALSPQSTPLDAHWVQLTNDFYVISNRNASFAGLWGATNWVPKFQFTNNTLAMTWTNFVAANGPVGTNWVWYAGFSFLTNVFYYDYRESDTNETVQLDVSKLATWITNSGPNGGSAWNQDLGDDTGWGINSIFIYNDAPFSSLFLPSVAVINGALLPSSSCVCNGTNVFTRGLTVATPQPLYVIGNYNVQTNGGPQVTGVLGSVLNTYPAAFMADAITILSTNWLTNWKQTSYSSRGAANTTVNAACLEGIVPSNGGQKNGGDGTGASYSGGIENFLRLLESWNGYTLTYNGSIMVMFPSQYATNAWQLPQGYYYFPNRQWGFDTNFLIQSDLPPLTPNFRTVIRTAWSGN